MSDFGAQKNIDVSQDSNSVTRVFYSYGGTWYFNIVYEAPFLAYYDMVVRSAWQAAVAFLAGR